MENQHVRALLRFWWVCAIGVVAALIAAFLMVEKVTLTPLGVQPRAKPTYVATELLILNSDANPYLRTSVTTIVQRPPKTTTSKSGSTTAQPRPYVSTVQPNAQILVRAANLYPHLIESDQVAAVRTKLYGPLPGSVQAEAYKSFQSATRYRPSSFPMIQITSTAHRSESAVRLARATTTAFERWLTENQAAAQVPEGQRILVQELQAARSTTKTGGTSYGLPFLVALVVFGLSVGVAIGLDRAIVLREPALAGDAAADGEAAAEPEEDAVPPRRKSIMSA